MTLLEAGKILNTHGVKGELKIENYCDDEIFFKKIKTVYIDSLPYNIISKRSHKNFILAVLENIDTVDKAMALKNKIMYFDKDSIKLRKGQFFISDIIGFDVFDERSAGLIGKLMSVDELPHTRLYVVCNSNNVDILIPDVPEFIKNIDFESKVITVSTIEGMLPDEN